MINFYISKPASSALLKSFFWLTSALLVLSLISVILQQKATFIDRIDLFLSIFATLGLFGIAYSKAILTVVIWRYFFYFGIIETLYYSILLPLIGYERYGKPFVFNGLYVFEIIYAVLLLYVLHAYAYKNSSIWMRCAPEK